MNLDDEYSPKAAQQAAERAKRGERRRQARQVQRQHINNQRLALDATPIDDTETLVDATDRLAETWGARRSTIRQTPNS